MFYCGNRIVIQTDSIECINYTVLIIINTNDEVSARYNKLYYRQF